MSQITGAFTVELDVDRIADMIAERVAEIVFGGQQRQDPAPMDVYDREPEPDGVFDRGQVRDNLEPGEAL